MVQSLPILPRVLPGTSPALPCALDLNVEALSAVVAELRQPAYRARQLFRALHAVMRSGLVKACHDLSEGGLGVAAAEMAFGGDFGAKIDLRRVPFEGGTAGDEALLWSESPSRFLVEVDPSDAAAFEQHFTGLPFAVIGEVSAQPELAVVGLNGEHVLREEIATLRAAWKSDV